MLDALRSGGDRILVVALRDPYDLAEMPEVTDYLCTFGPRWCSAEAAAQVLFGEVRPHQASSVSVPGTDVRAR